MEELSLHILDIAKNSVTAQATLIKIAVQQNIKANKLTIEIVDNGCGMDEEFAKNVTNPFFTSRSTRRVGMGLALLKQAAEVAGGGLTVNSKKNEGTQILCDFELDSIDRMPLGNLGQTMAVLIGGSPEIDFVLDYQLDDKSICLDTRELRRELDGVPLDTPEVLEWIEGFLELDDSQA